MLNYNSNLFVFCVRRVSNLQYLNYSALMSLMHFPVMSITDFYLSKTNPTSNAR